MGTTPAHSDRLSEELRAKWYNATAVAVRYLHEHLMILRVRPDTGIPPFVPGQYATLGLGDWEPCIANAEDGNETALPAGKLIRRAYSVSASLLNEDGQLVRAQDSGYLEFYITLVRHSGREAPSLTPRLFLLQTKDRLACPARLHGSYELGNLQPHQNVLFIATGTGEAPHNAMLAELLCRQHKGRIASVVCVRYHRDLGYLPVHRELERRYSNYRYVALTTRAPVASDSGLTGSIGQRHLQDYFQSGDFERDTHWNLEARNTEVFLCGNPHMIGIPRHDQELLRRYPQPRGMIEVLESRGFQADEPTIPGNIHFEHYW